MGALQHSIASGLFPSRDGVRERVPCRRAGWLAAGLVPLSSQSLSQSQHKMPLARKMLQKQQLGGLWEHF